MENIRLNNKPAIRIKAHKMYHNKNSTLMNCEGDNVWFPTKCIQINPDSTILIEEWLYNSKVQNNEL